MSISRISVFAAGGDVSDFAIDPSRPTNVYAAADGRVVRSVDGGATWRLVSTGLGSTFVTKLALDARSPATLYAGGARGVFKSTNAGRSWRRTWSGP